MHNIEIDNALLSLVPNCRFTIVNGEITYFEPSEDQPSKQEIDDELVKLKAEYEANQYARDRKVAYPSWNNQLDMQYHDLVDGTTTWKDAIQAIKDKYPKP